MKILFVLLLQIVLLELACTSQQNICKKNLKNTLAKEWTYDNKQRVYSTNISFLKGIDSTYKDCLIGKDTSFISKMFGTDYLVVETMQNGLRLEFPKKMKYTLYNPCDLTLPHTNCYFYVFYISNFGKVGKYGVESVGDSTYE